MTSSGLSAGWADTFAENITTPVTVKGAYGVFDKLKFCILAFNPSYAPYPKELVLSLDLQELD